MAYLSIALEKHAIEATPLPAPLGPIPLRPLSAVVGSGSLPFPRNCIFRHFGLCLKSPETGDVRGSRIPVAESSLHGCRMNLFSGPFFCTLPKKFGLNSSQSLRVCLWWRLPVIRFAAHNGKCPVDLFKEKQTGDFVRKREGRQRKAPVGTPDNPGGKAGGAANYKRDSA